jgi:hypothetical protein
VDGVTLRQILLMVGVVAIGYLAVFHAQCLVGPQ